MGTTKRKKRTPRPAFVEGALVTGVAGAQLLLDEGKDGIYQKLASGELESFLDGRRRKITVASIKQCVARKLAAAKSFERARHYNKLLSS